MFSLPEINERGARFLPFAREMAQLEEQSRKIYGAPVEDLHITIAAAMLTVVLIRDLQGEQSDLRVPIQARIKDSLKTAGRLVVDVIPDDPCVSHPQPVRTFEILSEAAKEAQAREETMARELLASIEWPTDPGFSE